MRKCDCEGTEAVTFCKDCGIGMDTQARALARVDEEIENLNNLISHGVDDFLPIGETDIKEAEKHLSFLRALRKAIERHTPEPYGANCPYVCSQCVGHHGLAAVPFPCLELTEIAKELGI